MQMSSATVTEEKAISRLPILGFLALSTASFLTILTEVMPVGLQPQIGAGLGVDESAAPEEMKSVFAEGYGTRVPRRG
jgi:predicted MFS family arabinose efflux permease